jgi:uncharacterized protein (DUF885 family)
VPGPLRLAFSALLLAVLTAAVPACEGHAGAPAHDARAGSAASTTTTAAARALHALFDAEWEHDLRESPTWASSIGDRRYDALWDDVSLAAYARRDAHDRDVLAAIDRIPRGELSREDALSFDLFRYKYATAVEGQPFRFYLLPINQRGGIQTADEIADELPFETPKNFADWNARLRSFPAYAHQTMELLAEGIRTGMTHPRVVMTRVVAQLDAQIVDDPTKSPFFAPYKKSGASAATPAAREEAARLVASQVVPAFRELRAFFVDKYLPACRETIAAEALPNGRAMYAYLVRSQTTTNTTPDAVHAVGLREVARIRGEMEAVKARTGFSGSMKEFFTLLRTDPRFYFKSREELLEAYRALGKRIDPQLVKVFRTLPRTPWGVEAIPDAVAADTTTAYYREPASDGSRAGTMFVNLYKPESRPKWEMVSLTLHEAVPGHHLQIALALEEHGIPAFRRHCECQAFVEGWALYAEGLGEEMGLYDDPYAKFGQLTYEMWRAVRLVVDTGMHHLGWDRKRAIDYFMENAAKTELDVTNEVDRYIAWPGQALAYKTGELRIRELRNKRVRPGFDLKAFHEAVLRAGPMPLDILEREVMREVTEDAR